MTMHLFVTAILCNADIDECDGERHICFDCGGEGLILDSCFEDTCCCSDPEFQHETLTCLTCNGIGSYPCPSWVQVT